MATQDVVKDAVDPLLGSVGAALDAGIVAPNPMTELAFALIVLVIVISVHGWCMSAISRRFSTRFAALPWNAPQWRTSLLVSVTIALLAVAHLFETLIWSGPVWGFGLIPNLRDTYFFVLEAYTTLGKGSGQLPESWRLVGPMIAISGLFTFSWTGSVLVYVMTETGRRHAHSNHVLIGNSQKAANDTLSGAVDPSNSN
jgi:hypothetical protein